MQFAIRVCTCTIFKPCELFCNYLFVRFYRFSFLVCGFNCCNFCGLTEEIPDLQQGAVKGKWSCCSTHWLGLTSTGRQVTRHSNDPSSEQCPAMGGPSPGTCQALAWYFASSLRTTRVRVVVPPPLQDLLSLLFLPGCVWRGPQSTHRSAVWDHRDELLPPHTRAARTQALGCQSFSAGNIFPPPSEEPLVRKTKQASGLGAHKLPGSVGQTESNKRLVLTHIPSLYKYTDSRSENCLLLHFPPGFF